MKKFTDMTNDDCDYLIAAVQRKLTRILPADTVAVVVLTAASTTRNIVISHLRSPLDTAELLREAANEIEQMVIESN